MKALNFKYLFIAMCRMLLVIWRVRKGAQFFARHTAPICSTIQSTQETDIAPAEPKDVVKNWLRSRSTIEFLGLWEKINNPDFKGVEFDSFKNAADEPAIGGATA